MFKTKSRWSIPKCMRGDDCRFATCILFAGLVALALQGCDKDYSGGDPLSGDEGDWPDRCIAAEVQRRRFGSTCSCRRRVGGMHLSRGLMCNGNEIIAIPKPVSPPPPPAPSPSPSDCIDLVVIGDFGSYTDEQTRVARSLSVITSASNPPAIYGIGDNIYPSGAEGNTNNIVAKWRNVYMIYESLQRPWHLITGNHDWYTDATTERDFTWHIDNVGGWWNMPDFWHKHSYVLPKSNSNTRIDVFMIDTQIWKGSSRANKILGDDVSNKQKAWLRANLQNSTADWKIVMGHHPIYTAGSKGAENKLVEELDPMLREFGVQIFFAGHEHSKQLIQHAGLNHVVSGAGGKRFGFKRWIKSWFVEGVPDGALKRELHDDTGFVVLQICDDEAAKLTFYNGDGAVEASNMLSSAAPFHYGAAPVETQECSLVDVERTCSSDGCKAIVELGLEPDRNATCADFCHHQGLICTGAWEPLTEESPCETHKMIECSELPPPTQASNSSNDEASNLMCQCGPA